MRRVPVDVAVVAAALAAALAVALYIALPPSGAAPPLLLQALGRFHTLAVHLPIGVLLLVASAELLSVRPRLRERIDPSLGLALPFLVATAVAAFSLGLLLAKGAGYPGKLVTMHRTFTMLAVVGTAGCLIAWTLRRGPGGAERRLPYRLALGATTALLTIGAHFGGSLTHGDTYLTKLAPAFVQRLLGAPPPPAAEPVAAAPEAEPLVFASAVMPVLKRVCVDCHGADRTKGGLRLDSLAAMLKGGENGAAVIPGSGAASPVVKRMLLPSPDDDHMPPADKPQPTSAEVELVTWWIDRGANETLRVRDALVPDGARTILGSVTGGEAVGAGAASQRGAPTSQPEAPPPAASSATAPDAPPASGALAYRDVVAPLLAARCGKCHGAGKQKGKLRVDSLAALLAGGNGGAGIVPADAAHGTLLARLRLPLDSDRHMPPKDEPPLSASQIAQLAAWIAHGASDTALASTLPHAAAATTATASASAAPAASSSAAAAAPAAVSVAPDVTVGPGQVALYRDVVAPLLVRRCGECHQGEHSEGGMRVDNLPRLVRDRDIVPGKPEQSPMATRMALPAGDEDRMPPKEKPPAAAWEADAVAFWIARGATLDAVVSRGDVPASVAPHLPAAVAAAEPAAGAASGSPEAVAPAGTHVPLRASGCGSCAAGAGSAPGVGALAAAVVALMLAASRRASRARRRW